MDIIHRITNWADHNRWTLILLLLAGVAIGWLAGCKPQTTLSGHEDPLTRQELQAAVIEKSADFSQAKAELETRAAVLNDRIESFNQQVQLAEADLQEQEQVRLQIIELLGAGLSDAMAGTFNPAMLIVPGLSLLAAAFGVGKTIDNRRKDKVIEDLQRQDE
jgi:lipopolysaccharide export system protein LptC